MNQTPVKESGFWSRHLDKVGLAGSLIAALCCLGVPAVLAVVSAVGLGFLINDATPLPLLLVFAGVLLLGLGQGVRHHRSPWALVLGLVSAIITVLLLFVRYS
ncbi:MAG: MerC domain-containing protein, partial [Candidatus Latescibacteria bacterium]|nr:MerC domain-containing protein [Candidatus Latescibacterota bacterium]